MASCLINKSISKVCKTQVAGLKRVAVWNFEENAALETNDQGVVTSIGTAVKVYAVDGDSNGSYFNCNLNQGGNSDSKAFLHQVGFIVNRLSDELINEYKNWVLGKIVVAVEDKNGEVYILGADNGLTATNFDYASGTSATDASGITALFEGVQPNAMLHVVGWDVIAEQIED